MNNDLYELSNKLIMWFCYDCLSLLKHCYVFTKAIYVWFQCKLKKNSLLFITIVW